jgi:cobalt-zinc-cadmium resistance protein CzcA
MIRALVDFALNNKFVVLAIAVLLLGWGAISFHNLPVEAYPDIADNYVTVITQWPGRSAEEVEQQVTIPIEIQMAGMPHMTFLRSESIFGLSFVIMIFDDSSVNDWNRQKVLERLTQVNLPPGQNLQPQIGTDWSTTGQIYWYTLRSTNPRYDLMELRSIEDWVLLKQFKSVTDVVDVSDFGGTVREYQVRVDPNKLVVVRIEHRPGGAATRQQQHQCRRQLCGRRHAADERSRPRALQHRAATSSRPS